MGSRITLRNNEIKDIMKEIRSLENRGILLKVTTKIVSSQEGGFPNFLRPLMSAGLPLTKNVLVPLAKSVLATSRLMAAASATDAAAIQKKVLESGITALIVSNKEINHTMKIDKSLE